MNIEQLQTQFAAVQNESAKLRDQIQTLEEEVRALKSRLAATEARLEEQITTVDPPVYSATLHPTTPRSEQPILASTKKHDFIAWFIEIRKIVAAMAPFDAQEVIAYVNTFIEPDLLADINKVAFDGRQRVFEHSETYLSLLARKYYGLRLAGGRLS